MPYKTDKIAIKDDFLSKRSKLIPCQRERIIQLFEEGASITSLAKLFHVNKRLIQFVLFPERLEISKQRRKERGGSKIYYKKEKHKESMKRHRNHKQELFSTKKNNDATID